MEGHMGKIVSLAGDAHCYQYIIVVICFLIWAIYPLFSCCLGFLENNPLISYYDIQKNETVVTSLDYDSCLWENNYTIVETYDYSWAIDINITCDKFKISLIGALSSLGCLFGSATSSVTSRAIGQRRIMIVTTCLFIILLLISLFVLNFGYFCFVVVLCQMTANTMLFSVMILFSEIISQNKKPIFSAWITSGLGLGGVIFIFLFYVCQNWKYVFICTMAIVLVMGIFIQIIFIDSPKKMLEMRDMNNFLKSMRFIAKINGRLELFNKKIVEEEYQTILRILGGEEGIQLNTIDSTPKIQATDVQTKNIEGQPEPNERNNHEIVNTESQLAEKQNENEIPVSTPTIQPILPKESLRKEQTSIGDTLKIKIEVQKPLLKVTPWCLLKYKSVRGTFLLFCVLWFCTSCLYSGLSIGIKSLPGSIYVNGLMLYCGETIGYFVSGPMMNIKSLGRKYSLMIFTVGFSACCFIMVGIIDYQIPCTVFYILTRFSAMSAFCIYYTYCLESYPSSIRGLAYGINGASNSLGGVVIPFIIEYISRRMLYLVYAILGLGCALLMLCLKETIGQPIPDNIKEMEEEMEAEKLKNIPVVVV